MNLSTAEGTQTFLKEKGQRENKGAHGVLDVEWRPCYYIQWVRVKQLMSPHTEIHLKGRSCYMMSDKPSITLSARIWENCERLKSKNHIGRRGHRPKEMVRKYKNEFKELTLNKSPQETEIPLQVCLRGRMTLSLQRRQFLIFSKSCNSVWLSAPPRGPR